LEELFGSVMYGLVGLHTVLPRCVNRVSEAPRAHPIAAFEAEKGSLVTNVHHHTLDLDALSLGVLRVADGRRGRSEMLAALQETVTAGPEEVESALALLARNGLLV
jgi:hypothetical protein